MPDKPFPATLLTWKPRVLGLAGQLIAFQRDVPGLLSSPVIVRWNIDKN